jgi:hypothetical protein
VRVHRRWAYDGQPAPRIRLLLLIDLHSHRALLRLQVNAWVQFMAGREFPSYVLFQLQNAS